MSYEKFNSANIFVLGVFASLIVLSIFKKAKLKKYRLLIVVLYGILAIGPILKLGDHIITRLPYYYWLHSLPPLSITRTPVRMGIVWVFMVTLMSIEYLDRLFAKWKPCTDGINFVLLFCNAIEFPFLNLV